MLNQDKRYFEGSFYYVLDTRLSKEIQKWGEKIDTGLKDLVKRRMLFVSTENRRGERP